MVRCEYCWDEGVRFRCNWCGGVYCGNHRLPEKHGCDGSPHEFQKNERRSVEPIDSNSIGRTGKRPASDFGESSPDVAPDGSIVQDGEDMDSKNKDGDQNSSLIDRLLFWR
ncbi:AN1-type zinc finger domain-containing protein [Natronomonas sp.]|uniref:AN1-type zinc finger domain-containing protein n=1 Tax=Natronomonas sp. TaxID=2184060 RepID=UPI003974ABD9